MVESLFDRSLMSTWFSASQVNDGMLEPALIERGSPTQPLSHWLISHCTWPADSRAA